MREIKFRAWDTQDKEMIDWYSMHGWILAWDKQFFGMLKSIRFKIMQFTGLKDKNGKEVYHKDRIEFWTIDRESGYADKWIGTIEWDEEDLC